MSRNKIALSFALAGILGASTALAETSGVFVGLQGNTNFASTINKEESENSKNKTTITQNQIGILGGYKFFFMPEFGVRAYGVLNYQNSQNKQDDSKTTTNILGVNANVDALYNFISTESLDFGLFAGVSLGYASNAEKTEYPANDYSQGNTTKRTISGFDAGINFGLRANVAQNHGLELYSRFGLTEQKKDETEKDYDGTEYKTTYKNKQPYTIGLRYTYSF